MTLQEKLDDARAEGYAEGIELGRAEARELAIEQARAEGRELARLAILRGIMEESHMTAAEAMDVILLPEEDRPRVMELLEG